MSTSFFEDLVRAASGDEAARRRLSAAQLAQGVQFLAARCLIEHLRKRDPECSILLVRDPETQEAVRVELTHRLVLQDDRPLKVTTGTLAILVGMLRAVRLEQHAHAGRLTAALIAQLDADNPAIVLHTGPPSTLDEADLAVAHV